MKTFVCPMCKGTHFGSSSFRDRFGNEVPREEIKVYCHDEHGKGCKWVGKWSDMPKLEKEVR